MRGLNSDRVSERVRANSAAHSGHDCHHERSEESAFRQRRRPHSRSQRPARQLDRFLPCLLCPLPRRNFEKDGLCLVVVCVRRRGTVQSLLAGKLRQPAVGGTYTRAAASMLSLKAFACFSNVASSRRKSRVEFLFARFHYERLVGVRLLSTKLMIEVRHRRHEAEFGLQFQQNSQQRHRSRRHQTQPRPHDRPRAATLVREQIGVPSRARGYRTAEPEGSCDEGAER